MSLRGLSAHDRHVLQASIYDPGAVRAREEEARRLAQGKTEFDLLKEAHRFIRDDDEPNALAGPGPSTALARRDDKDRQYADALARRYEASLFKEFALIDLKHYKSGRIALRWRTPQEVVDGAGEETCGALRCAYHVYDADHPTPPLDTFELPFAYEEDGARKEALVKVNLCGRCAKKLRYKADKDARGTDACRSRSRSPGKKRSYDRGKGDGRAERGVDERSRADSHADRSGGGSRHRDDSPANRQRHRRGRDDDNRTERRR